MYLRNIRLALSGIWWNTTIKVENTKRQGKNLVKMVDENGNVVSELGGTP